MLVTVVLNFFLLSSKNSLRNGTLNTQSLPPTIVKLTERQRLLLNLLRSYFARLARVETISTWDFSLNATPHHKKLEVAQFRGS